jgi:drug/metabolite transporter, DME family
MPRRTLNGYLISLLAAVSWAFTSPGISYLLGLNMPRLTIAFWRDVFVALGIVAIFAVYNARLLRVDRKTLISLLIAGVISIGLYHVLWVYSVDLNGPPLAVVLVYTYNAFVALGARVFFKEPLRRNHVIALVVSLAGLVLAVKAYDVSTWQSSWLGTTIGVVSALAQTVYVLYNQRFITSLNPLVSLGYQMAFGALAILALMLVIDPPQIAAVANGTQWLILIALAIGPTLGGYGFFNLAMRFIPGKVAGLISVLEVPFAAGITYLLFGDALSAPQYLGMVLVLIATVIANWTGGE